MEVIRGGQGDRSQEVRGEVERRGARAARSVDLCGEAPGAVVDEGAHLTEGGRVRGGRRLERQRDLVGAGHQHQQCWPHPSSPRRERFRGGADPPIQSELRPPPRIFDGAAEAKLIALTCSPAPAGFVRWSLRLLEEKVVELNIVEKASDNTIGRTLKKTSSNRPQSTMGDPAGRQRRLRRGHGRRAGNLPQAARSRSSPRVSGRDLQAVDRLRRVRPIPAKPGRAVRHDYEYERNGVANIFMVFAPLEGWRQVKVTDRHAGADYAQVLKELSDVHFPDAEQIRLVQDNLSTHTPASLYAAFPAPEARRLAKRFEWHYTPKHGSWLDMAESELGVLSSQCLSRRIPDKPTLEKEVAAWEDHRNKHHAEANWQFTTDDARVKLKRLYPSF